MAVAGKVTVLGIVCAVVGAVTSWPQGSAVARQEEPSGAPAFSNERIPPQTGEPGRAAADQPESVQQTDHHPSPLLPQSVKSDLDGSVTAEAVSQHLTSLDGAARSNATIELQLGAGATAEDHDRVERIVSLWDSGQVDKAIRVVEELETRRVPVGLGVTWKTPVPLGRGADRGTDSRIGPHLGASQVIVDGSTASDRIFAVVRWDLLGADPGWSVNLSTDDGTTWMQTYYWYAPSHTVTDLDMVVQDSRDGDFTGMLVAYIWAGDPTDVTARRFTSAGSLEWTVAWFTDVAVDKTDVALDSYNWYDRTNNRWWVRYTAAVIQSNNVIFWTNTALNGASQSTYVGNAAAGLDFCAGFDRDYDVHMGYISYIGTDGRVRLWRKADQGVFAFGTHTGDHLITTLSTSRFAYSTDIICAYEEAHTHGQGIRFNRSEDGGYTWWGQILAEPGDGESDYDMPSMPRHGWSAAFVHGGQAYFTKYNWALNSWSEPIRFSDYSAYSEVQPAIEYIPEAPGGEVYSYGLAYAHRYWESGFPRVYPLFDRAPGPGGYCHATGTGSPTVRNVTVGSIDNDGTGGAYEDFSSLSTTMARGLAYELTVTSGYSDPSDRCGVWIDWNQDLDFDDPGEAIAVDDSSDEGVYTAMVMPPVDGPLGSTRMRIRVTEGEAPDPCGTPGTGAVHDYTVEVVEYCEASAGCGQYISRVAFARVNNYTGCDNYTNYVSPVSDLYVGQEYPITLTITNGNPGNMGGLWIDWNADVDFFGAGEEISLSPSWGAGPYTATIVPPIDAAAGPTRVRARLHREADWTWPCDYESFGEVEDYAVNIVGSPYCTAYAGCGQYISRVQLGRINQASGCTIGYTDYSNRWTELPIGTEDDITITVTNGYAGTFGGLWIDWNQNGDFQDAGEEIALSPSFGPGPYTATIAPPLDATPGSTRMRARLHREADWTWPCDAESFGEVEDYTVIVPDPGYCIGYGGCGEHIGRVQLGSIDNTSGCSGGYANYTSLSTVIASGSTQELTIWAGESYADTTCSVWIDWNRDRDFDDAGESIPVTGSPGVGPYTATITPRPEATTGEIRMRIRVDWLGPYGPCDGQDVGEVEDYTLVIRDDYCDAEGHCGLIDPGVYISRVEVGSIDNISACNAYSDHTGLSTEMIAGASHPITVSTANPFFFDQAGMWVDWNGDLDFDDAGEMLTVPNSPSAGPFTATITPPEGVGIGEKRLRIRVTRSADLAPCGFEFIGATGEVEDYTIAVVEPSCPGIDGVLGLEELAGLVDCMAGPGQVPSPSSPECVHDCLSAFDRDFDLDIDLDDFAGFQGDFGGTP